MTATQEGDTAVKSAGATIDGVVHHRAHVNGTELHYVSAGYEGSPVLLVHGFPESWWTFHKLIPMLSEHHRVFAVDLRGFGDSAPADGEHSSAIAAADVAALITALNVGPVHLTGRTLAAPAASASPPRSPSSCRATRRSRLAFPDSAWRCSPT